MSEVSVGDVVQLKSGGVYMTVTRTFDFVDGSGPGCECKWYSPLTEDFKEDNFLAASLTMV